MKTLSFMYSVVNTSFCGTKMDAAVANEHDCNSVDEKHDEPEQVLTHFVMDNDDGKKIQFTEIPTATITDNVPVVDTPISFEQELTKYRPVIGSMFRKEDDFETFMRLPISDTDRMTLLQKLIAHKQHEGVKRGRT